MATHPNAVSQSNSTPAMPGEKLDASKMPGHWLLARLGKRVLRPGGIELTRRMLDSLMISSSDTVVELAPGLGTTARITLAKRPAAYIAVERDPDAAAQVQALVSDPRDRCVQGNAAQTGLPSESADVVYGEAMLTMQVESQKQAIAEEAWRILRPGGRYAIHELGLMPDDSDESLKDAIMKNVSEAIHVGARPLTVSDWRQTLEAAGLHVDSSTCVTAPMHLLKPRRVLADEGFFGTARIAFNVLRTPAARKRVHAMRRVFRRYEDHLCAVTMVGQKS
ncbi:class I SAM-dependent methyltransferase [Crateriforma conspicua]|uniref:class I SAM-dependent methyltransferase n=1 Tax=Crateriforma conspicua TaxID=2527996 RepID=UPI0011A771FA